MNQTLLRSVANRSDFLAHITFPGASMPTGLMKLPDGTIGSAHPSAATLAIDATTMRIRSVITTSQPDRAGDVVVPTGIRNIEEFLMNPVGLRALAYIKIDALTWRIPGAISRNAPS